MKEKVIEEKTLQEQAEESIKNERTLNDIGTDIVDVAFTVHKHMGPGLYEVVDKECLIKEFTRRKIAIRVEEPINIEYRGEPLEQYYVADIVVEGRVIMEIKAIKELLPVHEAQIINYLKLTKLKLGYLINFHVALLKEGIKRRRNGVWTEEDED
jgi:GxxExxY protein